MTNLRITTIVKIMALTDCCLSELQRSRHQPPQGWNTEGIGSNPSERKDGAPFHIELSFR